MQENINALDEIHKGATMGIDAVNMILEKVKDKNLKEVLQKELQSSSSMSEQDAKNIDDMEKQNDIKKEDV